MKDFKKTLRAGLGRGSHYHIGYLNNEGGTSGTSVNLDHSHPVVYHPAVQAQPPQTDPTTGEPLINPQTGLPDVGTPEEPEWYEILPADGHTHNGFEDYVVKEKKSKETDDDIVRDVLALYKAAREEEDDSIKLGREAEDFYAGDQWDTSKKREVEQLDRAALTINEVAKHIDELRGVQRTDRTDMRLLPQEGSDQRICDIYNILLKHSATQCNFESEESLVFEDQIIAGKGVFNLFVDYHGENLEGDIKGERLPWDDVVYGPHEKIDGSDREYEVKSKMYSLGKLKQLFLEKANDIEQDYRSYSTTSRTHITYSADQYENSDNVRPELPLLLDVDTPLVDLKRKEFRLIELWRKFYLKSSVAVNSQDNFIFTATLWDQKDVEAIKTIPGFQVVSKPITKIRITKICGSTVLSDENPADLPVDDFFTVLAYAYRRNCKYWGKVEIAKDPQREINKRRSQCMDIANKMASYGRYYDASIFPDNQKEKFKRNVNSPGFLQEVNSVDRLPVKEEGTKFPSEIVQLMQLDQDNLSRLMNITVEPGGANESGVAFLQKQKARLAGNEFLFDNLSFAKRKLAKLWIHTIRRVYSADRILRIIQSKHSDKNPVMIDGQSFDNYDPAEIVELLENADVTKMDVVVSESAYSPTLRMQTLIVLKELNSTGQIPPQAFFRYLDIPEEERQYLLQTLEQQQQSESQTQENQSLSEVEKTVIAKGIIPPKVAQQLGLPVQNIPSENGLIQNTQGNQVLSG